MNSKAWIRDSINLASTLNGRRLINLGRLYSSYFYSRLTGDIRHSGNPFTVSVEPTTSCNLHCPECPSGLRKFSRPTGSISLDLYRSVIDQLAPDLFYLILYFQGEPYLNPSFFDMVEYAGSKNIYTATSTNAHFLTDEPARRTVESGLDRLVISLDGTDQETYQKYRVGGSFAKVLEGIHNLARWKKELRSSTPYLVIQFIVFSSNEHQLGAVRKLARELGADRLEIKTAQLYQYREGNPLMPADERYSRYKRSGQGDFAIVNPLRNHCFRMWRGCVISWDGLVVPCCFDKDAQHQLGDLKANNFREIWRGEDYRSFRKKIFTSREEVDICSNCTEK